MSRAYQMNIMISGYDSSKTEAITKAADEEWEFEGWDETDNDLYASGTDSLYGGETEGQFTFRISKAIWEANGAFCKVKVDAFCLEDMPHESHELSQDDYDNVQRLEHGIISDDNDSAAD